MTRSRRALLGICAVVLAIAATSCRGDSATPSPTPSPTPLSNPNDIVALSLGGLEAATSFHVDGSLSGSIKASALSAFTGGIGLLGTLKIDGASMTGDVDMTKAALHASATFPSLFGISADVVYVDGYAYTKLSALGGKYTKSKVPASLLMASAAPEETLNFADALDQLRTFLGPDGATATLVGRETVGGRATYHVIVTVPADLLNQAVTAAGGAAASGFAFDLAPVDYWVYVDTLQPAKILLTVSSPKVGNIVVALTLTRYGQPVTIEAPLPSQIGGG